MDSKLLYSLMLDRSSLSAKNGWLDEEGRVYIFYMLEQIMADMHCANQKATKLLKELETKAGLIERQKQGQGKPTRIYVKDFATGLPGDKNRQSQTHENRESRDVIITSPDSWKSFTNNTNTNQTDLSQTDLINLSVVSADPKRKEARIGGDKIRLRKQYEDYLREKLSIDFFIKRNPYDAGRINEILELMVDVLCSKAKTIRISGDNKPIEVVKAQFMKIDSGHLEYILDCFKNQISDIRNMKQYLLATIYNAPLTIDHYYTAKVSYDMAN
ncbi:replication initiator protein A (RepA) [Lachnospiraceae bacterium JC7]|nr:replication initiator protein A (RepA) [Lachnospiraceae bacterium JC7]